MTRYFCFLMLIFAGPAVAQDAPASEGKAAEAPPTEASEEANEEVAPEVKAAPEAPPAPAAEAASPKIALRSKGSGSSWTTSPHPGGSTRTSPVGARFRILRSNIPLFQRGCGRQAYGTANVMTTTSQGAKRGTPWGVYSSPARGMGIFPSITTSTPTTEIETRPWAATMMTRSFGLIFEIT